MRWIALAALLLGAHYALTAVVPGDKGLMIWPFSKESRPTFDVLGSGALPITQLLSVTAGACLLAAVAATLGWLVPAAWFRSLVLVGSVASVLLFGLNIRVHTLIPLAIDAFLVWGILGLNWTVSSLQGG